VKSVLNALLIVFLTTGAAYALDYPQNTGFVTDTARVLTPEQRLDIEREISQYENRTGTELGVLIVANTGDQPIADYAIAVANKWGVGKKGVDNGALLVVAMETHKMFIAVGRQLEGAITDSTAASITRNVIRPRFKEGKFYEGIKEGIVAEEKAIAGETFTDKRMEKKNGGGGGFQLLEYAFIFGVFIISWLAAVLGRSKEIWPGGALGAVIGAGVAWFLSYAILTIIVIAVVSGGAGLAFDWIVSKNYDKFKGGGPMPPWWMGGGMGGFGGGSSGGSGSFGGGSFSGGGGGSDW
jgi:uncharacterized protein